MSLSKPPYLSGAELRRRFRDYFVERHHTSVPSGSLIPDDPTLFFTNAGMVPFKDVFTGKQQRPYTRAVSVQKCLRISGKHNDLEEVGHTPRHHTFFEMLGNFSFGDYFKEEAIVTAWELLTKDLRISPERLWVTVHDRDDEAWDIWTRKVGFPESRLQRLGDKENFWMMGDVGPCGPCSEIHYDLGPSMSSDTRGPAGGDDRYMEFWNLVFMQYERFPDGSTQPLPRPSVDTGMGLERISCVVQNVLSNYETDLLRDLIEDAAKLAGLDSAHLEREAATALQVLADHSRATAFLVAEGVIPSNEARGYALRRIMRRAIRYGVKLGMNAAPFFHRLTEAVVERFGEAYPELQEHHSFIREVVRAEEERFAETRDKGLLLLERELEKVSQGGQSQQVAGEVVFRLYDTFGFPPDMTQLIAREHGVEIDLEGYERHMEQQRNLGRAAWKGSGAKAQADVYQQIVAAGQTTNFTGYTHDVYTSEVVALLCDGQPVEQLEEGQEGEIIVRETPFYGESGGQIGDTGSIESAGGEFEVRDTQKPLEELVVHRGVVRAGRIAVGEGVKLAIDAGRRDQIRRSHTATHLLHFSLKKVLGEHAAQKGSLVVPDRLRFDFSHHKALTPEELQAIEQMAYQLVLENHSVTPEMRSLEEAKQSGAVALFGEKYGEQVRVLQIGDIYSELCGGTHVRRTGDIGLVRIIKESGIASGVRRIEALTGVGAFEWSRQLGEQFSRVAGKLRTSPEQAADAVEKLLDDNKSLRKELEETQRRADETAADELLKTARDVNGARVLTAETSWNAKTLKSQADRLRDKLGSGVVVVSTRADGMARLVVAVSKDLAGKKISAAELIKHVAPLIGGKGGGRPDLAEAAGNNPAGLSQALDAVHSFVDDAIG